MAAFNAIEFAIASANEAHDQRAAYADPVGSYFDNVVDTMNDKKITGNQYHLAIEKYWETIASLFADTLAKGNLFDMLSHAGVHEIECETDDSNNGAKDGSSIYFKHNGTHLGTIFQDYNNPNKWAIYQVRQDETINGEGLDSLLNTIKEIRDNVSRTNIEFGQLFDALSHAGVHEIEPANGDDGAIVVMHHNGVYFGTIGQKLDNTNGWTITKGNSPIHGTGLDSLLNTIKEIRKY